MPSITLTISSEKWNEFKTGFLARRPIPLIPDPEQPDDPSAFVPEFTEAQWIKEWIRRIGIREYKQGKIKMATDVVVFDEEIIQ